MATPTVTLTIPWTVLNGQQPPGFDVPNTAALVGQDAWVVISQVTNTIDLVVPSGWTLVDSLVRPGGANTQKLWLAYKRLVAGDINARTQFTWAGGVLSRNSAIMVIVKDAAATPDVTAKAAPPDAVTADFQIPRITVPSADVLVLSLVGILFQAGTATTIAKPTTPGSWVELAQETTTNTTNPKPSVWAGSITRSGGAGGQTALANLTHVAAFAGGWTIGLKPASATPAGPTTRMFMYVGSTLVEASGIWRKGDSGFPAAAAPAVPSAPVLTIAEE